MTCNEYCINTKGMISTLSQVIIIISVLELKGAFFVLLLDVIIFSTADYLSVNIDYDMKLL